MFDLEKAIADWRDGLCCNDAMTLESAMELRRALAGNNRQFTWSRDQ